MTRDNGVKSVKHFAIGAVIGVVAGAVAGMLFAPKSGKEMRGDLKDSFDDAKDFVGDKGADVAEFAKNTVAGAKESAGETVEIAKKQADEAVKLAKKQLDKAKEITRRVDKGKTDVDDEPMIGQPGQPGKKE